MGIYSQFKGMHHYIEDSSILTLSYPGSRVDQLWSKLEDIAIITIILNPGCQQPFLIRMASDNRLSAAVFGPKWLVTTGCQQPLPSSYAADTTLHLKSLREKNSESMKARFVILVCDTSSWPVLHNCEVSWLYSKGYSSYRADTNMHLKPLRKNGSKSSSFL